MNSSFPERRTYRFGEFELQTGARLLTRSGERVAVGSKAFELLTCLVMRAGEVVTKEELLKTVWPNSFVEESNLSQHVFALRRALGDCASLIATVPGRGYQFTGVVRAVAEPMRDEVVITTVRERSQTVIEETVIGETAVPVLAVPMFTESEIRLALPSGRRRMRRTLWAVAAGVLVLAVGGLAIWSHERQRPEVFHSMVVADFVNSTGDGAFDQALKRALEIDLGQSPAESVMGTGETVSLLAAMGRPASAGMTGEVAREVCVRGNRQMLLTGGIASMGKMYLLTLEATDCLTGKKLAGAKAESNSKEGVLQALDQVADSVRSKLGESAESLASYQVPIAQGTTSSLEALKLYSLGGQMDAEGKDESSTLQVYQRVVEIDPQFAMAWGAMANEYYNLNEYDQAAQMYRKAISLSDRVSLRERLVLQAHYYGEGLGDKLQAAKAYELWAATFPQEWAPEVNLCNLYNSLGKYAEALPVCREGLRRQPNRAVAYSVLVRALKDANQFDEARAVGARAIEHGKDSTGVHSSLYEIAVHDGDQAAIDRETAWAAAHGDSWYKWEFVFQQAATAATQGRYKAAKELFRQAAETAGEEKLTESERDVMLDEAVLEEDLGLPADARATLGRAPGDLHEAWEPALVHAEIGDFASAEQLLVARQRQNPQATKMVFVDLPLLRATLDLGHGKAQEAIDALRPSAPYEMMSYRVPSLLGAAYLKMGQPIQAVAEYRKVIANPGIDVESPLYPLAHLGLARAYAAMGDRQASRGEYEAFLAAWKDADAGLPPLVEAQAEVAKLQ